jgi:molybdenum cofactor cytidylyltransferase
MISAIVPAAGKSERMGRCKLTLRIGKLTVIEHVVGALQKGGADPVVVVTGSREVQRIAESAGAVVVWLTTPTSSMRATVERGLDWLEFDRHPTDEDAWLLMPGDYPNITAEPIQTLCEQFRGQSSKSILVPVHNGSRGHPILIPWPHVVGIRALPAGSGIDDYVKCSIVVEIPVSTEDILHDVDTPMDLKTASERAKAPNFTSS